ncbi:RNA-guided endonuclease InsQ/TnpB family protein [Actinoplanes flavus]|uniref:Transposase n=1 Tax=Actinoplanes flavus TaxID=2820290 RepID=A0ABS3UJ18_9ACTN|nr:RNA-guided endonuclease TnpB family protein [Actinoplanes flavus]MBO3738755.1 transposase [Actinoplanes flavus]
MVMVVERGYRFRFYPTPAQADLLTRTFGCVRLVYNLGLQARRDAWQQRQEALGYGATSALLTGWKKTAEYSFLTEVSSVPLQQALRHLDTAYQKFFGGECRYPRFKSRKRSRRSAEFTASAFTYESGELRLAKLMDTPLAVVWSRPLPEGVVPSTVTVSQDRAGRWFVSLRCKAPAATAPATGQMVGIDAGLNRLLTFSTGEAVENPRQERRERGRPARAQRELARKEKGSRNREKARVRVARVQARVADRRRDMWHQVTTRLVRENQVLVIEDLAVRNMLKNHTLARAISDASWGLFRILLESTATEYGRTLIVVPRWYPSTRLCSHCGVRAAKLDLSVRAWTCTGCNAKHDRDVNAARNILAAGLAVTACGADVGPQRGTPSGRAIGDEAGNTLGRPSGIPVPSG